MDKRIDKKSRDIFIARSQISNTLLILYKTITHIHTDEKLTT